MSKPKILLITDVFGWGGDHRGQQIMKHLSDEFEFELITQAMFGKGEHKYKIKQYDLFYPLFHVQLRLNKLRPLLAKTVTVVTGRTALKEKFNDYGPTIKDGFLRFANQARAIFVNNLLCKNELESFYDGKVFYVPRGVDEKLFSCAPYPTNSFAACFVGKGRMPQKGYFSHIVPACKKSRTQLYSNILNYRNAVSQEEVKRTIYDRANVMMVASTVDGTPNPALEAAACGRPIISNKIGNMPEFIEDGVNGFLVPRNIQSYMEKINWMKKHPTECEKMGINARKTVEDEWSWSKTLNNYERIALRRVLE